MQEELLQEIEDKERDAQDTFDLIVIGAGPAGMSAAVCAGRANLKTLIIDKALPGGQTATAYMIDNYLGFPGGMLGERLSEQMEQHLNDYGITYLCEAVQDISSHNGRYQVVRTNLERIYKAKAIILATGLEPKNLDSAFEQKFIGRGISYYARGDAEQYLEKDVAVIGGGNCACYAADYLSQFVNQIYMIHSGDHIKAVARLKEKIMQNPKIQFIWESQLADVFGLEKVEKIKLQHVLTGQHTWLDVKGVFVYVGRRPPQEILQLGLNTDEEGYIITDEYMRTNIKGIYAAGDIRAKQIRQIATAVSDGMIAAVNVERDFFR